MVWSGGGSELAISLSTYTPRFKTQKTRYLNPTSPSRSGGVLVQGIPVEPKGFVERCIPLFDLAFRLSTLPPPVASVAHDLLAGIVYTSREAKATQSTCGYSFHSAEGALP
jgi:hypothetical protein